MQNTSLCTQHTPAADVRVTRDALLDARTQNATYKCKYNPSLEISGESGLEGTLLQVRPPLLELCTKYWDTARAEQSSISLAATQKCFIVGSGLEAENTTSFIIGHVFTSSLGR